MSSCGTIYDVLIIVQSLTQNLESILDGHKFEYACRQALNAPALMKRMAREEGFGALWKGMVPRALWHAPAGAICWAVYEAMKRDLGVNVKHSHDFGVLE